jgi:hypothetical protein
MHAYPRAIAEPSMDHAVRQVPRVGLGSRDHAMLRGREGFHGAVFGSSHPGIKAAGCDIEVFSARICTESVRNPARNAR